MKGEIIWPYDVTISFWPQGELKKRHYPDDSIVPGWIISNATLVPAPGEHVSIRATAGRHCSGFAYNRQWQYWHRSSPGELSIDIDLWETRTEYEAHQKKKKIQEQSNDST